MPHPARAANLNICMGLRTGSADLPLHGGRVPEWLASRMARLGRVVAEAIVHHYGRQELLRRLAHPFWFQSFGAVMGMDWHSSGITTSVLGALKRGLGPVEWELGLHVCGGRGRHSRKTPDELVAVGSRVGFDGAALAKASRLVAKVDSAAVQDGFDLYLHGFVVADDGSWTVVQQGMNTGRRQARRYHWLSENLESFVDEPHSMGATVWRMRPRSVAGTASSRSRGCVPKATSETRSRASSWSPSTASACWTSGMRSSRLIEPEASTTNTRCAGLRPSRPRTLPRTPILSRTRPWPKGAGAAAACTVKVRSAWAG